MSDVFVASSRGTVDPSVTIGPITGSTKVYREIGHDGATLRVPFRRVNLTNAEHYVWGEVCEGWRLLDRPDLSVIHERIPPGRGEVSHYHSRAPAGSVRG